VHLSADLERHGVALRVAAEKFGNRGFPPGALDDLEAMFANGAFEMIQVALVFGDLFDHHHFAVGAGNRDFGAGLKVFQ